jgi:hypothetical protein
MRVFAALAVVAALVAPAHASSGPTGIGCEYVVTEDPTVEPGNHEVTIVGGPVLDSGTLTCWLASDRTGTQFGPSVSGHGSGVNMVGPYEVNYWAPPGYQVYLCTAFTDDSGATYYWDGSAWSTDRARACVPISDDASCSEVTCTTVTTEGPPVLTVPVPDVSVTPVAHLAGRVDIERFALPTGGSATLACVVLIANGVESDPCRSAGGTYVSTIVYLPDEPVLAPVPNGTIAQVSVCHATVTLTVLGIGVEDFPAYTLC